MATPMENGERGVEKPVTRGEGGRSSRSFEGRGERGEGRGDREGRGRGGGSGSGRRRVCRFCTERGAKIDYKDAGSLRYFLSERGKIVPRRISGNCAFHQRRVASAIKRARMLALLPYTVVHG